MERELRTYQRVAHQRHFCDNCCRDINSGDMYEGRVVVTNFHGLLVYKTHVNPMCDFPEDPEGERNSTNKFEKKLELAA